MANSTVYQKIVDYLLELIQSGETAPNAKLPSERELAQKFKASRIPIRTAYEKLVESGYVEKVHGKGHFIKKTTADIEANVQLRHTKNIYFITPDIRSVFVRQIIDGIYDFCKRHALDLSIKISDNSETLERNLIRTLSFNNVKGCILFPIDNELYNYELLKLAMAHFPITIIDRYFLNMNLSFVSTDNYAALYDAVRFFHEKNFTQIVYATLHDRMSTAVQERINGFCDALLKFRGHIAARDILYLPSKDKESYKQLFIEHLTKYPDTEIMIVTGDQVHALIAAVNELGIPVPERLKLALIDCELSENEIAVFRPYRIEQDGYRIGYEAATALYNQIYQETRITKMKLPALLLEAPQ